MCKFIPFYVVRVNMLLSTCMYVLVLDGSTVSDYLKFSVLFATNEQA